MNFSHILNGFLVIIFILAVIYFLPDSKEGFIPKSYEIAPKKYSAAHSENLLGNAFS